jgi:hypothetical protein
VFSRASQAYELLEMMDEDHSGVLSRSELQNGLQKFVGLELEEQELDSLMKVLDNDASGDVSYGEFSAFLRRHEARDENSAPAPAEPQIVLLLETDSAAKKLEKLTWAAAQLDRANTHARALKLMQQHIASNTDCDRCIPLWTERVRELGGKVLTSREKAAAAAAAAAGNEAVEAVLERFVQLVERRAQQHGRARGALRARGVKQLVSANVDGIITRLVAWTDTSLMASEGEAQRRARAEEQAAEQPKNPRLQKANRRASVAMMQSDDRAKLLNPAACGGGFSTEHHFYLRTYEGLSAIRESWTHGVFPQRMAE